ncbi:MAG: universal stress protein [Actinomycetota bacterium]|nr:universal stress protein [Actinomycetota bacterium]
MERFPTRILLATDGSECAESAGRVAVDLANRSGAELDVVHAFEFVPPREYAGVALRLRSPAEFAKQGQKILDEQVDRIGEMGGEVADARLCVGSPVDQILCRAEASGADLVVVGRRGLGGVKRLLMGSVSEGIVQHASCPVLVVCGEGEVWPPERVVISDDSSEDARRAGELAAAIGGLFGAEGVLVQVYPRVLKSSQEMSALESKIVDHALREAESELEARAEELAPLLGSTPEVKLLLDEAAEGVDGVAVTILEEAAGAGVPSLISVGRRGLGAVQRARVGSVSTKVVRAAQGPVLVYPHARADSEESNGG